MSKTHIKAVPQQLKQLVIRKKSDNNIKLIIGLLLGNIQKKYTELYYTGLDLRTS